MNFGRIIFIMKKNIFMTSMSGNKQTKTQKYKFRLDIKKNRQKSSTTLKYCIENIK